MNRILSAALATAAVFAAGAAGAQTFPTKPIRIVVATAPGPGVDYVARTIAPKMQEDLGQPLVIENQSGEIGRAHV